LSVIGGLIHIDRLIPLSLALPFMHTPYTKQNTQTKQNKNQTKQNKKAHLGDLCHCNPQRVEPIGDRLDRRQVEVEVHYCCVNGGWWRLERADIRCVLGLGGWG
jgi:hypothetical protein